MATVSAGSFARVFCPLASDVTVTPGAQARVIVDDRDAGGAVIQIINAATTFAVSAGSSVQIEAINADAVYTEPAFTAAQVAGIQSVYAANAAIAAEAKPATAFPDEAVRLTASGCACAAPCYITRIRCVVGTSIALVVYDNPAASSGTQLYSGTLSAGEEAVLSAAKVRAINGVRLAFTGTATFDTYVNTEAA
jgi:hypothetical protein